MPISSSKSFCVTGLDPWIRINSRYSECPMWLEKSYTQSDDLKIERMHGLYRLMTADLTHKCRTRGLNIVQEQYEREVSEYVLDIKY